MNQTLTHTHTHTHLPTYLKPTFICLRRPVLLGDYVESAEPSSQVGSLQELKTARLRARFRASEFTSPLERDGVTPMTMKRAICILTEMETEDSVLRGRSAQEPKEAFIARSSQTSRCELPGFWCHITCSRGGCFVQPSGWICRAWLWCQREMKAARLFKLFNCLKCFDTKVVAPTKSAGRIEGCSSSSPSGRLGQRWAHVFCWPGQSSASRALEDATLRVT